MPDPVATITTLLNIGTRYMKPYVGSPRIQTCVGGFAIIAEVQSPAREMMAEYPRGSLASGGAAMVANVCHSASGLRDMRVKEPGPGVTVRLKARRGKKENRGKC